MERSHHPHWIQLCAYGWELASFHVDVWFLRQKLLGFLYETTDEWETPESGSGLVNKKIIVIQRWPRFFGQRIGRR
jgi:hypothetical protein